MASKAVKVTISLPQDLLITADKIATEKNINRSKLIYLCLRDLAEQRQRQKMEEGYKALAKDNLKFANQAIELAQEMLSE